MGFEGIDGTQDSDNYKNDDEFNIDEETDKEADDKEFNSKQSLDNAATIGGAVEEYKVIKLQ